MQEQQRPSQEEIEAARIRRRQSKQDARKKAILRGRSYSKDNTRRVHLKCKIKSLADESKIVRNEEEIQFENHSLFITLNKHRKYRLRIEARHALLAYGFLNGLEYRQIETHTPRFEPDWNYIEKLVNKFGVSRLTRSDLSEYELACAYKNQVERLQEWIMEAKRRFQTYMNE